MSAKKITLQCFCIIIFCFTCQSIYAQWQKTAGPPGISIFKFYQRGKILFAGTYLHGVYKSSDNGATWMPANNGIAGRNVSALIANDNYLFAGTDSGVYRSPDNGNTWQAANTGIKKKYVKCCAFVNGYLFAGTSDGLFKSNDEGITWQSANGGKLASASISDITFSAQHLIVITNIFVRYSNDYGETWSDKIPHLYIRGDHPSFFTKGDSLLVSDYKLVHRSLDGGITWSPGIPVTSDKNIDGFVQDGKFIAAGTSEGLFYTNNFGRSWKKILSNNIRDVFQYTYHFYKSGKNFLLAYAGIGVGYSSDSGRSWNYSLQGFTPAANSSAIITQGNFVLSDGNNDGVYKSTDAGNTWAKIGTTDNTDTLSNANVLALYKDKHLLLAGTSAGLYRSADNGGKWQHITNGLPVETYPGSFGVFAVAKTTNAFLIGTNQGLFYSVDKGLSWLPTNITARVVGIAANDSVACAALDDDPSFAHIYRSVKNPAVWKFAEEAYMMHWSSIASNGKSHFYAGTTQNYNFVSADNGLTWDVLTKGIPLTGGGYTIAAKDNIVFIGNADGIYFSDNYGALFKTANQGFDKSHTVQSIALSSNYVYAGLAENSIWKRSLSDFNKSAFQKKENNQLAVTFIPNPLVNKSTLMYKLEINQHVVITLYNAKGNFIRTIKDETQSAGSYSVSISKVGLQTGNYFISVLAGNKHAVVNVNVKD